MADLLVENCLILQQAQKERKSNCLTPKEEVPRRNFGQGQKGCRLISVNNQMQLRLPHNL